ncbi:MAG TPA: phosphoribosylformylglycinamidine synthase subunit PurQ [Gemmatimonadales bacterium]
MVRVAVVRFPGSNCEDETLRAVRRSGGEAFEVRYRERDLRDADVVILPGGFSYGDYLRAGAIARFSPVLDAVIRHAADGRPVLGVCNGFQILCEAGLLPGALVRNEGLHFVSRPVAVRVERADTVFTSEYRPDQIIRIPIGHGEGRYVAPPDMLEELEGERRVVLRYVDAGFLDAPANPNGALADIAAIGDPTGLIVGMMPHPERLADPVVGSDVGLGVYRSIVSSLTTAHSH